MGLFPEMEQGSDPNRIFSSLGRKREGKGICFQRLAKGFVGGLKELKMRCLVPTATRKINLSKNHFQMRGP
jgi:hypothetical protein